MEDRLLIKKIHIKNFRSIRNESIDITNLNIFVGLNDCGKSNVLKALNLFFNNQTDYNEPFDFKKDFSYLFPEKSHGTKEIAITIEFIIPNNYKESGIYTWKKAWRTNGYFSEKITNKNGKEPSSRSRIPGTLRRIRYRYVPAVKSKEYYKSLLSDLYYTVSAVIDSPLKDSINGFSQVLHDYTSSISSEVGSRIKIDSKLSIPDNLSDLFRTLVFQTSYTEHNSIPLSMRGDGIQARHIPIVLKYIADEDTKICKKGSMKVSTIWGFEEPENGVELRKAFEMSKDFVDYSEDIQMFITTHSPAFYSINNSNKAQVIYVSSGEKNQGTKLSKSHSSISIGDTMGLMPVVAPFIREKEEELDAVRQLIDDNNLYDVDTIFVEGETDIKYLTLAINLFSTKLKNLIDSKKLLFFTRPGEGGCKKLYNYALAWIYSGNKSKALMLFDKDKAGKLAKQEITEDSVYKSKLNKSKVKADFISPSPILQTLLNKHINIPFEVESLLSTDFLRIMYEKELLEKRSQDELFDMVKKIMPVDKTVSELLYEKCSNSEVVDLIILNVPKDKKKNAIYDCLNNFSTENQKAYMEGFKPTISFLEKYFCK